MAMLSEYLNSASDVNVNIYPHIQYISSVSSHYFIEIAKLRATRLLAQTIYHKFSDKTQEIKHLYIHTETSARNKTAYSKHTNILRVTTEAMSANIGGADSFLALPFDEFTNENSELAQRIARNTQIILHEEAYIDKISDPSKGSYFIENLTDKIAEAAWNIFMEIEAQGGYIEALKAGFIQNQIEETAQKTEQALEENKVKVLGVNRYPDKSETIDNLKLTENKSTSKLRIKPLSFKRVSESIEKERFENQTK